MTMIKMNKVKNATLKDNITTEKEFADVTDVDHFVAENNIAGLEVNKKDKPILLSTWKFISATCATVIGGLMVWYLTVHVFT